MQLINLYIQAVLSYSSTLATFLCLINLTDWRVRRLPIQGNFDDGWSYAFHGSGCYIVSPFMEVDFDSECKVGGLASRGGGVAKSGTTSGVSALQDLASSMGRNLKSGDAKVVASANAESVFLITRDKKLRNFMNDAGLKNEGF